MPTHSVSKAIVLAAGGSGGHVFPAIALAEYVHNAQNPMCIQANPIQMESKNKCIYDALTQNHPVILMTDSRGARFIEKDKHLFAHIEILKNPKWNTAFSLYKQIKKCYAQWNPTTIIGFGGMMTLAPLMVGKMHNKRCAIHQSDAIMGKANRVLSPWMDAVFVGHALEDYKRWIPAKKGNRWHSIGTPTRRCFQGILPLETISKPLNIVILGGSQGAKIWSCLLPIALSNLSIDAQNQLNIRHQCPLQESAELIRSYAQLHLASFQVSPFFSDMSDTLRWSHVVFSRAGASTLAELRLSKRAAFLLPYPHAADNHQWTNAQAYIRDHKGWIWDESSLTPQEITAMLQSWLDKPEQLLYGEKNAVANLDACSELYHFCTTP